MNEYVKSELKYYAAVTKSKKICHRDKYLGFCCVSFKTENHVNSQVYESPVQQDSTGDLFGFKFKFRIQIW